MADQVVPMLVISSTLFVAVLFTLDAEPVHQFPDLEGVTADPVLATYR